MSRVARQLGIGVLHHVITGFVDRSWQLVGDQERSQYLARLAIGVERARWTLIGYALMSNHIHLLMVGSDKPLSSWAKPVHVGMAQWLNRRFGRRGPVFSGRPYCEFVEPEAVPIVLAYVHNNPVRARVVQDAAASTWTSHRAYLGLEPAAKGLDIHRGLTLAGFTSDVSGREDFSRWVEACARVEPEGITPSKRISDLRSAARERLEVNLELGTATRDAKRATFPLLVPGGRPLPPHREFEPQDVIRAVFAISGVNLQQPTTGRPRTVTRARRIALELWSLTGRHRSIMVRALGMTPNGASQLLSRAAPNDPSLSLALAKALELVAPSPAKEQVWSTGTAGE